MNEKKLRLNKETIRNLSDESLAQVAGGKKKGESVAGVSCNQQSCVAVSCNDGDNCSIICTGILGVCVNK